MYVSLRLVFIVGSMTKQQIVLRNTVPSRISFWSTKRRPSNPLLMASHLHGKWRSKPIIFAALLASCEKSIETNSNSQPLICPLSAVSLMNTWHWRNAQKPILAHKARNFSHWDKNWKKASSKIWSFWNKNWFFQNWASSTLNCSNKPCFFGESNHILCQNNNATTSSGKKYCSKNDKDSLWKMACGNYPNKLPKSSKCKHVWLFACMACLAPERHTFVTAYKKYFPKPCIYFYVASNL